MAKPVKRTATNADEKAEALRLAEAHGAAEASRRTGIPAPTIRMWRSRERRMAPTTPTAPAPSPAAVAPASPAVSEDWRDGREQTAAQAAKVAREAIETARKQLKAGSPHKAQAAMIAAGIAVEKMALLEQQLVAAEERSVRLAEAQMEIVAAMIEQFFDAVGLPFDQGSSARRLIASMFRQAGAGEPIVASPALAQPAWSDVREVIGGELRDQVREDIRAELRTEVEAEVRAEILENLAPEWRAQLRGLPAPTEGSDDAEPATVEPMVPPRTVIRARPPEPEIVTGEIVDEPPFIPASRGMSERAASGSSAGGYRFAGSGRYSESDFG